MTDPRRLLEEGSDLEIAVLDSARDDAAPKDVHGRVYGVLGLGTAIGAATTTAAARAAGAWGATAAMKWAGVAVIGSAVAVGATVYVGHHRAQSAIPGATPTAMPTPAVTATATATEVASATAVPIATAMSTPSSIAPPTASALPSPADLASELAYLDAAHAAIDSGDTTLALAKLDRHDHDFPRGRLGPESLALRIEAYTRSGNDSKVLDLARAFLARYPNHPQARRVQSIVASIRDKP
jgi:hypothetical protein